MPLSKWERLKSKQFSPCFNVAALLASFIDGEKKTNQQQQKTTALKIHPQLHVSREKPYQLTRCVLWGSLLYNMLKPSCRARIAPWGAGTLRAPCPAALSQGTARALQLGCGRCPALSKAASAQVALQHAAGLFPLTLPSEACVQWEPKLTPKGEI